MSTVRADFGGSRGIACSNLTLQQAGAIVVSYGDALANHAPPVGSVADASTLPFTKSLIKRALIALLEANTSHESRACLTTAYLRLSDWQEGVGEIKVPMDPPPTDLAGDTHDRREETRPQTPHTELWRERAEEERQQLQAELQELGFLSCL